MNCVTTGKIYEEKAAVFLEKRGFLILEKNYRCRQGEIDIIGIHEKCLVFAEVKYRKNEAKGMPEEAVGVKKQMKICRTSDYFRICRRQYAYLQVRYDVIAIVGEKISWYRNAFPYRESGTSASW